MYNSVAHTVLLLIDIELARNVKSIDNVCLTNGLIISGLGALMGSSLMSNSFFPRKPLKNKVKEKRCYKVTTELASCKVELSPAASTD